LTESQLLSNILAKMDSAKFKAAGYQMIEYSAQYMETLSKRDPLPQVVPGWLQKVMPNEAPKAPEPWEVIMNDFEKVAMEGMGMPYMYVISLDLTMF